MELKTYSELVKLPTFIERIRYLKLSGRVSEETFGVERYLNQQFYKSKIWKELRNSIILRDNGCDLGLEGYGLNKGIIIHHMNPITVKDVINLTDAVLNPEYLICVSHVTHNVIHYGDESYIEDMNYKERSANDTCPWRMNI